MKSIAGRAEELLGTAVAATTAVAGGDICTATRLRLSNGTSALMKTHAHAPAGFFETEARGLRWLAEPGAVPVGEVLAVAPDCIVLAWVEPGRATADSAAALGRGLAALHAAGAETFGAEREGFIGTLPLPNGAKDSWPEFYATRRLLPYLKLARDRGHADAATQRAVEGVVRRLETLAGPPEPPARLHGDLWSGNVVWGAEAGAVLVDPAAYGGHRETDLAMLSMFGLPELEHTLAAYDEAVPLAEGWRERQPLHQLFPLLVHAALFGGGYGEMARAAAERLS